MSKSEIKENTLLSENYNYLSSDEILRTPQKRILEENFSQYSLSLKEQQFKNSHNQSKPMKRGNYKKYTPSQKRQAINLALKINDYKKAADIMKIPKKNLKRWIDSGRKKPDQRELGVENKLVGWIEDFRKNFESFPTKKMIQSKALELSNHKKNQQSSEEWYKAFISKRFPNKKDHEEYYNDIDFVNFLKNEKAMNLIQFIQ